MDNPPPKRRRLKNTMKVQEDSEDLANTKNADSEGLKEVSEGLENARNTWPQQGVYYCLGCNVNHGGLRQLCNKGGWCMEPGRWYYDDVLVYEDKKE